MMLWQFTIKLSLTGEDDFITEGWLAGWALAASKEEATKNIRKKFRAEAIHELQVWKERKKVVFEQGVR